jgi:hypothetical protein
VDSIAAQSGAGVVAAPNSDLNVRRVYRSHLVDHPCEDFSSSDELCGQCEAWWDARVAEFARELGQEGEWSPWATPFLGDGVTRFERGNTITSQRSRRLDRAFRVILTTEPTVKSGFDGWVQPRDEALDDEVDWPANELFVILVWGNEPVDLALKVLARWMQPDTNADEIERWFADRSYDA